MGWDGDGRHFYFIIYLFYIYLFIYLFIDLLIDLSLYWFLNDQWNFREKEKA